MSFLFFFKQKTAYEMRISDWSSDVCSSDLERLADLHGDFLQGLHLGLDGRDVVALRRRLQVGDGTLGSGLVGRRHLVAGPRLGLLGGLDQRPRLILRIDQGAAPLVLLGVALGILHPLREPDALETSPRLDADAPLLDATLF